MFEVRMVVTLTVLPASGNDATGSVERAASCRGHGTSSEFASATFPPTVNPAGTGLLRGGWLTGGAVLIQRSNSHQ